MVPREPVVDGQPPADVWRDPAEDGGPPNNWIAAFTDKPAWTFDEATGQYYLHCFLPEQPDLNWANPQVEEAMHDILRFWLDRGIDGFRIDVVHLIGKDPALANHPEERSGLPHVMLNDAESTHGLLRGLRTLVDSTCERVTAGRSSCPPAGSLPTTEMVTNFISFNSRRFGRRGPPRRGRRRSPARSSRSIPSGRGRRG